MTRMLHFRMLHFLILRLTRTGRPRDIVSVSLREGIDFLDELYDEWGDLYVLETAEDER